MKKVIKILIFLFVFNIILLSIAYTLLPKNKGYNSIDYFKYNNTLDIIWLGPSTTYLTISPMYIWNKYKVTSFNNAHTSHRLTSIYLLNDMKKYNPKVVFFDISIFLIILPNLLEAHNRIDNNLFKWFLNMDSRYKYLQDIDAGYGELFYFHLLNMYHNRWKQLNEYDFINNPSNYYFLGCNLNFFIKSQPNPNAIDKYLLIKEHIYIFNTLIKYIKDSNLNVILWCPPTARQDIFEYSFLVEDIINKFNITYINFNKLSKEISLDYNKDFFDSYHMNAYCGEKVSDYLIEYAIKNYNIKTHENDPAYASWNEDYIKYARAINRKEIIYKKSFQEWQNLAYYDNYTMLISTNGDNVLNRLPQDMKDKFKTLGLNKFETDKKNQKYAAIIDNNQVFFEEVSDNKVEYKGRMKNKVNLLVSSEPNKAIINVSGKPRSKNRYGINFVIYDKVNREIVDSIWVDPAQPDVIRR